MRWLHHYQIIFSHTQPCLDPIFRFVKINETEKKKNINIDLAVVASQWLEVVVYDMLEARVFHFSINIQSFHFTTCTSDA